jgi:hypothetical protein
MREAEAELATKSLRFHAFVAESFSTFFVPALENDEKALLAVVRHTHVRPPPRKRQGVADD